MLKNLGGEQKIKKFNKIYIHRNMKKHKNPQLKQKSNFQFKKPKSDFQLITKLN